MKATVLAESSIFILFHHDLSAPAMSTNMNLFFILIYFKYVYIHMNKNRKLLLKKWRDLCMKGTDELKSTQKISLYCLTLMEVKDGTIFISSLLIEKDLLESWNISIKFLYALIVYLCLSYRDLSIFSVRVSLFYSYFCIICTSILSFSTGSLSLALYLSLCVCVCVCV